MNNRNTIRPFIASDAKILIVDDSNVTLKVQEDLMKTYGMNVSTAKSGEECINLLRSNKYDIIFMDHIMPNMDGMETTLNIRKIKGDYFQNVIIIALTSTIFQNSSFMYIQSGFNDFLEKPIDNSKLNKILRTYLPRKYIIEENHTEPPIINFEQIKIENLGTKKAIQNCFGNIENIENNPKIKDFTIENLLTILDNAAVAIDNFDLDSASESLNRLLDYNLSHSQISVLNRVKSYMNIFDYDNAYELIMNFKYTLYSDIV